MKFIKYNGLYYKACCGNCEYYDPITSKCLCEKKIQTYKASNRFMRRHYKSDVACSYFSENLIIPYNFSKPKIELLNEE